MAVYKAGTLLIPSGPSHDVNRRHLHVVCNDADETGHCLLVGITAYSNSLCDDTCVLEPSEHPWLWKRSYVLYRRARKWESSAILRGISSGKIEVRDDMNAQTFLRVKNGVCRSPHTSRKIKRYFGCK